MREKGDGRERGEKRCVERTGASEKEIYVEGEGEMWREKEREKGREIERERGRGSKGGGRE